MATSGNISVRRDVALAVFLSILGTLLFAAGFVYHCDKGRCVPPQMDSLLYYQYARAMAEGHAYRFIADEAPSTGSTSHLYPAVLSICHLAGARGSVLPVAGFILAALALAATLLLVVCIARKLAPDASAFAVILAGLSGHLLFALFGQSDVSLFIPLALGVFAAALYGRRVLLAVLVGVAVFCRPEGIVMTGLLVPVMLWLVVHGERRSAMRQFIPAIVVGVTASALVLLANKWLTGTFQYQSLVRKGYFHSYPFSGAVIRSASDFARVLTQMLWGITSNHRMFYMLPVAGGLLFLVGVIGRTGKDVKTGAAECWMLLSAAAGLGLVALSSYADAVHDRYLAWFVPLMQIYVVVGLVRLGRWWGGRRTTVSLFVLLLSFQIVGLFYFIGLFTRGTAKRATEVEFLCEMHEFLPADATLGVKGRSGVAYYMPGRRVRNVSGITSPVFQTHRHFLTGIERMKHEPETRPDYWLSTVAEAKASWLAPFVGVRVGTETSVCGDALSVFHSQWPTFERVMVPCKPKVLEALQGMEEVDRLDIGYEPDESSHRRIAQSRIRGGIIEPFVLTRPLCGQRVTEIGEVVLGLESFVIRSLPERRLRVVMRTIPRASCFLSGPDGRRQMRSYHLASPLRLIVVVDGNRLDPVDIVVESSEMEFDEVFFDIPGEVITGDRAQVVVGGDHISCAFWFYQ